MITVGNGVFKVPCDLILLGASDQTFGAIESHFSNAAAAAAAPRLLWPITTSAAEGMVRDEVAARLDLEGILLDGVMLRERIR